MATSTSTIPILENPNNEKKIEKKNSNNKKKTDDQQQQLSFCEAGDIDESEIVNNKRRQLSTSSAPATTTATATTASFDLDISQESITLVHFTVGHKTETALVPKDASSDDIKGKNL